MSREESKQIVYICSIDGIDSPISSKMMHQKFIYRKVASSRRVYYSIFQTFISHST